MRAILHREYGTPDVLTSEEIARPAPGDDEVLVQVRAAGANIGDHHVVTGKPYLIRLSPFGGLPRPKHSVPGAMLAGVVTAVGTRVTTFKIGDEVFGQAAHGAFAEYVAVPAGVLAPKPKNLSFEEAACVPWAATALQGLRDAGGLVAGQKVLINGASGGVGTWAVQIAKAFGAEVTAVCSTRNVEQMRALGAAEVIDYTKEDYATGGPRFDLFFDTVGNRPLSDCLRAVKPKGTYVACAGGGGDWVGPVLSLIGLLIRSLFSSRKLKSFIMTPKQPDLMTLKELVEAGKARPIIEQSYALSEVGVALTHVGAGHAQGQTVIRVAGS
jgi:NADPH:quinone reductase-like Zn-dependent oxidoreductase